MILKTDKVKFTVYNKTVKQDFNKLSEAIIYLKEVKGFLGFTASSPSGDSSLTANLMIDYNGRVEVLKPFYWQKLIEFGLYK